MPLPHHPEKCLIIIVPDMADDLVLAMAKGKIYLRSPGSGMTNYFQLTYPKFHVDKPFGKVKLRDDDGNVVKDENNNTIWVGTREEPDITNATELAEANTIIQNMFNNPQELGHAMSMVIGTSDVRKHSEHGTIKIAVLKITPETQPVIEGLMDEWIALWGTSDFTDAGHTLDANGRPVLMEVSDVHSWMSAETIAKKLTDRNGVPLWKVEDE